MGPELDERQDVHHLLLLAVLIDDFWHAPTKELAAEIRLQRRDFGLTVMSRRSLAWEIDRGGAVEAPARPTSSNRRGLHAVPDPFAALA